MKVEPELVPVIQWFLKDLATKYGRAGCNDVMPDLRELLTDDVKEVLRPHMDRQVDESDDFPFGFDFCIVYAICGYLSKVKE